VSTVDVRGRRLRSVREGEGAASFGGKKFEGVEWAEDGVGGGDGDASASASAALGVQNLGDESTIAQVHPKMLCDALWAEASKPVDEGGVGSELVQGEVVLLAYAENKSGYKEKKKKKVTGATLADGTTIRADAILCACGTPWTTKYRNPMTRVPSIVRPSYPDMPARLDGSPGFFFGG